MTVFLHSQDESDKAMHLKARVSAISEGRDVIHAEPSDFFEVPGSPFAYWCPQKVRHLFTTIPRFLSQGRLVASGGKTQNDPRFLRANWEVNAPQWRSFAKGGMHSLVYSDVHLVMNWANTAHELKAFLSAYRAAKGWGDQWSACLNGLESYFRPGLTWPRRTQSGLGMRIMPAGCIFADKGPAAFVEGDNTSDLLALLAIATSSSFRYLVELQMAFGSYEVGVIQRTPVPTIKATGRDPIALLAHRAWSLKRNLDTTNETSHAFLLPSLLRGRLGSFDPTTIATELTHIQHQIDDLAFNLYGVAGDDRAQIEAWSRKSDPIPASEDAHAKVEDDEGDTEDSATDNDDTLDLVSWSVGVAFSRFDIRLATGIRAEPPQPEPFDPLPVHSPGMLPEGDPPFRHGTGILVDDLGHRDDLTTAAISVLNAVKVEPPSDLGRILARDFFPFHIQRYSKSRRKAPIYWQLATPSASYSVWLYLHAFSADTLYKVQNDYVGPKLRHEEQKLDGLRREYGENPTASQRKELDSQETFVAELRIFLDEVKRVAPLWKPDLDDGVIINFAPLWRLVPHHRTWQKECKATWDALADGDFDWSHLAMHLWPERVVPKCPKDRSLAIAHGLEEIFWAEDKDGKWKTRPTPTRPLNDLIKERTSPAVKAALGSLMSGPQSAETVRGRKLGRRTQAKVR
jgi:hypothetical protein